MYTYEYKKKKLNILTELFVVCTRFRHIITDGKALPNVRNPLCVVARRRGEEVRNERKIARTLF